MRTSKKICQTQCNYASFSKLNNKKSEIWEYSKIISTIFVRYLRELFKNRSLCISYTLGLLTDWLTDSLTHSSVRKMLLKTWQRWISYTVANFIQGFRQQVTWPMLHGGNNLDHVYLKGDMIHKLSTFLQWSHCKPGENLLLDEKKNIRTIGTFRF